MVFHAEYLNNSVIKYYNLTITRTPSGGAAEVLVDKTGADALSKGYYDHTPLLSRIAATDAVDITVEAYKTPTQNTATLTATPYPGDRFKKNANDPEVVYPPATEDADGNILAAKLDKSFAGSELKERMDFYFDSRARGSLRIILDFTKFQEFLETQGNGMQTFVSIERQPRDKSGWRLLAFFDMAKKTDPGASPPVFPFASGNDKVESHRPLDLAQKQYQVELTVTSFDDTAVGEYRFVVNDNVFSYTTIIAMRQPMYAGEAIDRTAVPLEFKNGTQYFDSWPEPASP